MKPKAKVFEMPLDQMPKELQELLGKMIGEMQEAEWKRPIVPDTAPLYDSKELTEEISEFGKVMMHEMFKQDYAHLVGQANKVANAMEAADKSEAEITKQCTQIMSIGLQNILPQCAHFGLAIAEEYIKAREHRKLMAAQWNSQMMAGTNVQADEVVA